MPCSVRDTTSKTFKIAQAILKNKPAEKAHKKEVRQIHVAPPYYGGNSMVNMIG